jgi:hypothetical protein
MSVTEDDADIECYGATEDVDVLADGVANAMAAAADGDVVSGSAIDSSDSAADVEAKNAALFEEAKQLLSDEEGIKDFRNLMLTMGLHATRSSFHNIMKEFKVSGDKMDDFNKRIADISPITEIGCMQVDFLNKSTNKQDRVYLVLDVCQKNHDLTAELDKIKPFVTEEKWVDVLKSLANLIFFGRTVYANESRKHVTLIHDIVGPETKAETLAELLNFKVDPDNTTLYLDPLWSERIGIFVRRGD